MNRLASCKGPSSSLISFADLARGVNTPYRTLSQPYHDFTRRGPCRTGHRDGVQGYIAFLRGKRVTYWGRTGDQHTEWFPGAEP